MFHKSPPRKVTGLSLSAATAVAVPTAGTTWVNVERQRMVHTSGFAQGEYAILPDKAQYDRIQVSFGPVTTSGAAPGGTIALWGRTSEGDAVLLGTSAYTNGAFPSIEFDNHQTQFFLGIQSVTGSNTAFTVDTFISGVYKGFKE